MLIFENLNMFLKGFWFFEENFNQNGHFCKDFCSGQTNIAIWKKFSLALVLNYEARVLNCDHLPASEATAKTAEELRL